MKKFLLAVAVLCSIALPARAVTIGEGCYTPDEAEAEQAIRIHSELMIIALNCQHSRFSQSSNNLYTTYRQFTVDHGRIIKNYESVLVGYFQRVRARDPEAGINDLRTRFANKISLDAAKMRPDVFCYEYAPRIDTVAGMSDEQFKQWAATSYRGHTTRPLCPAQ